MHVHLKNTPCKENEHVISFFHFIPVQLHRALLLCSSELGSMCFNPISSRYLHVIYHESILQINYLNKFSFLWWIKFLNLLLKRVRRVCFNLHISNFFVDLLYFESIRCSELVGLDSQELSDSLIPASPA